MKNLKPALKLITVFYLFIAVLPGCSLRKNNRVFTAVLSDEVAERALAYALDKVGCPYVWGGQGPDEFDCSGLVIWAYTEAYPRLQLLNQCQEVVNDVTADELWRYNVLHILPGEMRKGDLVFITNTTEKITHVGLFIRWVDEDTFEFVNASSFFMKVADDTWPLQGIKREQWFVGAGRMKTVL